MKKNDKVEIFRVWQVGMGVSRRGFKLNPFPAVGNYYTTTMYAKNKYICFLLSCRFMPVTKIFV